MSLPASEVGVDPEPRPHDLPVWEPRLSPLLGLLVANAIAHGIVVARCGMHSKNLPFFVLMLVYGVLALVVYLAVPHALWAVLLLATISIVGLTVTFNKRIRDKTPDKVIWLLGATTVLYAGYLLFEASLRVLLINVRSP